MRATKNRKLRETLEERRAELQGEIDRMDADLRSIGVDQDDEKGSLGNHLAEDGSNVMEAERITTITSDIQDVLVQINGALERLDDGSYGTCEQCGKTINEERLEAFPYVANCIECQTLIEREHALRAGH